MLNNSCCIIRIDNRFELSRILKSLLGLSWVLSLASCQHKIDTRPALEVAVENGVLTTLNPNAQIILASQWHLAPNENTRLQPAKTVPQAENQNSIYRQIQSWVERGQIENAVVEGCEGEIKEGFAGVYNGWSYDDLRKLNVEELSKVQTQMGLRLKARFQEKLKVLCGDDLALIKRHQLVLSDLRGLSGFRTRIIQYKDQPQRSAGYISSVRTILKLDPSTSAEKTTIALDDQIRKSLAELESVTQARNQKFLRISRDLKGRTVVVIGALHTSDLEHQFENEKIHVGLFRPLGLVGDEFGLVDEIKKSLGQN